MKTYYSCVLNTSYDERIQARMTEQADGGYLIELLANGMALHGEQDTINGSYNQALAHADAMVAIYVVKANRQQDAMKAAPEQEPVEVDMGGDFEGFIEAVNGEPVAPKVEAVITEIMIGCCPGFMIKLVKNGTVVSGPETCIFENNAQSIARQMLYDYEAQLDAEAFEKQGVSGSFEKCGIDPETPYETETVYVPPVYETAPVVMVDETQINARLSALPSDNDVQRWFIELRRDGLGIRLQFESFDGLLSDALAYAEKMVSNYVDNGNRRIEASEAKIKHDRIEQLRQRIERLDRERESLVYELRQLTGE